jgi:hypothetical protein
MVSEVLGEYSAGLRPVHPVIGSASLRQAGCHLCPVGGSNVVLPAAQAAGTT